MIHDLERAGTPETAQACDVLVIGAGVAGLLMAVELAAQGLSCAVLESGAATQDAETHVLNEVEHTAQHYSGAAAGRFRCLGGTSTRWGGALLPFLPEDLGPHTAGWDAPWPVELDALLPYLSAVESHFDLPRGPYDLPDSFGAAAPEAQTFAVRSPKWPAFRMRNLAHVFDARLKDVAGPQVWLQAHVTGIEIDDTGRARSVTARSPGGRVLRMQAREVVVAGGAIESTRLLLHLDACQGERLFEPQGLIGRHFHDHLSAPVAALRILQPAAFARQIGFRFQGAGMRSMRFELTGAARRAGRLPGAFAHVAFTTDGTSGFDGLREVFRAVQRRELPALRDAALIAANAGWFARAAWARMRHGRVLAPDQAQHELHLVTEQQPRRENRIRLAPQRRDMHGVPLASIDWRVGEPDLEAARRAFGALQAYWQATPLAQMAELQPYADAKHAEGLVAGGGIYHPGGTLRMGATREQGVVDAQLRCFAVPNLRVVSTAVFPSGGGANPTLMLMLFGLRAVDHIARGLRSTG